MPTLNNSKLPSVTAKVGDTLLHVRDSSTYRFDFSKLTDDDLTAATEPCIFMYSGPNEFTLPPTRFVSLDSVAATVIAIRVSPQLEYLDQAKVLALADSVESTVSSAGWKRSHERAISRAELLIRLKDESGPDERDWIIGGFVSGSVEMDFRLRRIHRKGSGLASLLGGTDQFLLNIQCNDEQIAKAARQNSSRLRAQDGVAVDSFGRPINLESYTTRLSQ